MHNEKEDFNHEQEDYKSYNYYILQMIKLVTSMTIKFIVNQDCIKLSN